MVRKTFAVAGVVLLLMLIAVAASNYTREWKTYQRQYFYQLAREQLGRDPNWLERLAIEPRLGTIKVVTDPGRAADLCMTCHVNWGGTEALTEQPLADLTQIHPQFINQNYPFDRYGCTACHGGSPLALTSERAHEGLRDAVEAVFEQKVAELTAPDWITRQKAIETLRWMTGNDFGYRQDASPEEMQVAIQDILNWWMMHRDTFLIEGFGERPSPFKTENPLAEAIVENPNLSPQGKPLEYVNDNACVACHTVRTRQRLEEAKAGGDPDSIAAAQRQLEHIRLFAELDLSDVTLADKGFERIVKNATCQACHGPGEEYIKLMQKGYALLLQGQEQESSDILKRASEIARANARRNLSEPHMWELLQEFVRMAEARPEAPEGVPPTPTEEVTPPQTASTSLEAPGEEGAVLVAQGERLAQTRGCLACHSTDGSPSVGPTWKGLFGKTESLADGTTVTVDEAYLKESILDPGARIVEGFPNVMPPFSLSEEELAALIAYLKSL